MASVVSAIVSLYNAERFLRGRLDDLCAQTLYAQGRLEIICVVAGSKQYEARILREYLHAGVKLKVITSLREGIYQSWNRGIRLATGDYLTNANADDRLAPDALERLAVVLDDRAEADVVYADSYVTDTVNAAWNDYHLSHAPPYTTGTLDWGAFNAPTLARFCCIGHYPVWRKSLHARFGEFDESYLLAGDYEYWLRIAAQGATFLHLPERKGLFYYGENSTTANQAQSDMEARRAQLKWRHHLAQIPA